MMIRESCCSVRRSSWIRRRSRSRGRRRRVDREVLFLMEEMSMRMVGVGVGKMVMRMMVDKLVRDLMMMLVMVLVVMKSVVWRMRRGRVRVRVDMRGGRRKWLMGELWLLMRMRMMMGERMEGVELVVVVIVVIGSRRMSDEGVIRGEEFERGAGRVIVDG